MGGRGGGGGGGVGGYELFYLENFKNGGVKVKINRDDMLKYPHFDIWAMPQ
ncbi:hypothetical protein AGMMS49959_16910 [Planctomycetales bacterium]|nr:hypothetical protein AGMMS49959_16910 [Planctomycetales bacterium]